jgi:hypothetical protein
LTVQYAPAIVAGPSNLTVTVGQPAKFTVSAVGVNVKTNPLVCQWYFNEAQLLNATSLTLSIPATRSTNSGTYYLVISNSYGSVTSSPATLTVLSKTSLAEAAHSTSFATYSGLFYPPGGATLASSGFFTATVGSGMGRAFSANLLLDGASYPLAGKFDSAGNAQLIVPRVGKTPVIMSLHLNSDPAGGQMSGVVSNAEWCSILQAGRASFDAARNPAPDCAGQYTLMIPSGSNAPVGYLNISNTPGGTAFVTGSLADGARLFRAAPMAKDTGIPLYVPLYSGKGLFLGWITLTNSPGETNFGNPVWIKPGSTNATAVLMVK